MTQHSARRTQKLTESDGELVGRIFCTFCGNLNEIGAEMCSSCGQYIADQGPDLSARLRRIRRYASQSPELDTTRESTGALMGVDSPPQPAQWKEAIAKQFGPYTRANIMLLAALLLLGFGMIAIFKKIEWPYVVGIFLLAAILLIRSRVMPKPSIVISGDECTKALQHAGFRITKQRGNLFRLRRSERAVIVPKSETLDGDTLRIILEHAGMTIDEFLKLQ